MTPELLAIVKEMALKYGLDPILVACVCHHESNGWNQWAARYEPAFYSKYVMPLKVVETFGPTCSKQTERTSRATSYGLMQVMGQTAREHGFKGEYLTELCDPRVGIEFGCRKLAASKVTSVEGKLLAYNGGGDADYPKKVLKHYSVYEELMR